MMKTPVILVTTALTVAILLTAAFLVATGTRGEGALVPPARAPDRLVLTLPAK